MRYIQSAFVWNVTSKTADARDDEQCARKRRGVVISTVNISLSLRKHLLSDKGSVVAAADERTCTRRIFLVIITLN